MLLEKLNKLYNKTWSCYGWHCKTAQKKNGKCTCVHDLELLRHWDFITNPCCESRLHDGSECLGCGSIRSYTK